MSITHIEEIPNEKNGKVKILKEKMDRYVPNIEERNPNIPRENGMIWLVVGAGGSGKTNMLLSLFRKGGVYRGIFDDLFYFVSDVSFRSLEAHPFQNHEDIYHELSFANLNNMYSRLLGSKQQFDEDTEKWEKKDMFEDDDPDKPTEEPEMKYHLCIIDDFADQLKEKSVEQFLKTFCIKNRHLCCGLILVSQEYSLIPKKIRKMMTHISIYEPRNMEDWELLRKENLAMNKEDAMKIYNHAFDKTFNHFDFDKKGKKLYKNFNELIISKS
jgi:hypothetical protein